MKLFSEENRVRTLFEATKVADINKLKQYETMFESLFV